jgi:hypothetical protein
MSYSIVILCFIYALIIFMEIVYACHLKSIGSFRNKYLLWFWLSLFLLLVNIVYQTVTLDDSVLSAIISLALSIFITFSLGIYLLFRGMLVLFRILGETEKGRTYLTIEKLKEHSLLTSCCLAFLVLLSHIGRAYVVIWLCLNTVH